jgi:hypothetical protein
LQQLNPEIKMKKLFLTAIVIAGSLVVSAQTKTSAIHVADSTKKIDVVETSCGECNFKLEGKGCHLAVRINGKAYFVDGTSIDEHGDAHAKDGFCEMVRKANVQGEIVNNRFKATFFKLLPPEAPARTN